MNEVAGRIRLVDQDQFRSAKVLGIILGFAFGKLEGAFARQHVGEQLAEEQQDQAEMNDPDTSLFLSPLKTGDVRRDQVNQQQTAEKITARENREPERGPFRRPIDEEAAKE